jgi:hypothetical protein
VHLQYFAPGIFGANVRWRALPVRRLFDPDGDRIAAIRTATFRRPEPAPSEVEVAFATAPPLTRTKPAPRSARPHTRRVPARPPFRTAVGIVLSGDPIYTVVKFRRDGPWARGVVEG